MDEIDHFWFRYFGVTASTFERTLLAQIMVTIAPEDPQFVIPAMQTRQIYLSLDGKARALLEFGPAISKRFENMQGAAMQISSDLSSILIQAAQVKQNIEMLDAHLIDRKRSLAQRVIERAITIDNDASKSNLQWIMGLCLAFISSVVLVAIWTP